MVCYDLDNHDESFDALMVGQYRCDIASRRRTSGPRSLRRVLQMNVSYCGELGYAPCGIFRVVEGACRMSKITVYCTYKYTLPARRNPYITSPVQFVMIHLPSPIDIDPSAH